MQNDETPLHPANPVGPGQLIANRYRLVKSLGSGTFGQVFLAEDLKFKPPRRVALKFLHPYHLVNPRLREDLEHEASILASLEHPNILQVIDYDISETSAYIVTRYAEGGSLTAQLNSGPDRQPVRLPLEKVAIYLERLADALDYAHSQGLIHRDIKPHNILLDSRDQPLLADFGLATPLANSQSSALVQVKSWGTPYYMAPEQWRGHAGKVSDIYSLAVMTYQLITGQPPFMGNQDALAYQHLHDPVPPLSEPAPGLQYPLALDTVFAGVLAKDPQSRTRPAMEFYRRYRAALASPVGPAQAPTESATYNQTQAPARPVTNLLPISQPLPLQPPVTQEIQTFATPAQEFKAAPPVKAKGKNNNLLLAGLGVIGLITLISIGLLLYVSTLNSAPNAPVDTVAAKASQTVGPTITPGTTPRPSIVAGTPVQVLTSLQTTLSGHTEPVYAVAWSPDGNTLASGSQDKTIRLWSVNGQVPTALYGHTSLVTSVAWSPDGKTLASGSADKTVRLWSATGQPIATFSGHTGGVGSVAWSPDGKTLASASLDSTVRLWSATGQPVATLTEHTDHVLSVAWSPDGKTLASASDDKTVRLWTASGQFITSLTGHTDGIFAVAWSPDNKTLATGSRDKTVRLWSATGQPLSTLSGHSGDVNAVAWSPDGKIIASGSGDNTVRLWTSGGQLITTLAEHNSSVTSLAWSPDGETLASASSDSKVRLWSVTAG